MFIGTHYHTLDTTSRVSVPKPFRSELEHGAVITRGLDGCLFLFTGDSWSLLVDKLGKLPLGQKAGRDFLRLLTYHASPLELDKLGRTHLPESLKELSGITKDVVFAGALTRIELWSKDKYHAYVEHLEQVESELETTLGELGI